MSDAELRELEQRFQVSPSEDLELELLRARLRAGVLSEERLKVATLLRHAVSRRAHEDRGFLEACDHLDRLAQLEAALEQTIGRDRPGGERAREALAKQEEPTREAVLALVEPLEHLQQPAKARHLRCLLVTKLCPAAAFRLVIAALRAAGHRVPGSEDELVQLLVDPEVAFESTPFMSDYDREAHAHFVASSLSFTSLERVADEVLPWALGHGDPLRDRPPAAPQPEGSQWPPW